MSTTISQVGTVAVPVSDVERALAFYVGVLGFETRMDATFGEGQRWVEVAPLGATTTVALAPSTDAVPAGADTGIRLTSGATVLDVADAIHHDLGARCTGARVWGHSARFDGQQVGRTHALQDGDTVEVLD